MQPVTGIEQYYAIIRRAKTARGPLRSNCALFPDAIDRYIRLNRFFCEETEAGVLFFSDEEDYYSAYYYVDPEIPFSTERKDKPVMIQNISKGDKKQWLTAIETSLAANGFEKTQTLRHGVFVGYDRIPQIRRAWKPAERIFQKEGLRYAPLRREQIPEMLAFRKTIPEMRFYLMPYYTDEELMKEAEAERLCCVTDAQGRIIAARHLTVSGGKTYGWVGIAEKYQTAYGISLMFLCRALDYIEQHNLKMCSWVAVDNVPSLQYHERLGTEWTGHTADIWLSE